MNPSRRRGGAQKADLLKWVNDQRQLKMRPKYILKELASFAGEDCCAWAQIATLAEAANCEDRCVQYNLRELEKAGLILRTSRVHRLENSTRTVPIYQLAPEVEGLGKRSAMGAEIAPIAAHGCKNDPSMGAKGVHPHNENIGVQEEAHASSACESEREALFVQLNEACPKSVLKVTDNEAAWAAFNALAERGVDLAALPGCMTRMAVDPLFTGRRIPPSLEAWLTKGQWRGWLGADAGDGGGVEAPTPPAVGAFAGPAALRAAVVAAEGEAFAACYLDRARFADGVVTPATGVAFAKLRQSTKVRRAFAHIGVELAEPALAAAHSHRGT